MSGLVFDNTYVCILLGILISIDNEYGLLPLNIFFRCEQSLVRYELKWTRKHVWFRGSRRWLFVVPSWNMRDLGLFVLHFWMIPAWVCAWPIAINMLIMSKEHRWNKIEWAFSSEVESVFFDDQLVHIPWGTSVRLRHGNFRLGGGASDPCSRASAGPEMTMT